ncbi:MAG TPA: LytTR family DNA-binding domain-containing protein [Chitinophagaceae bacterium]|nr:LytTR family DNA-binding domain-containing protein [Chitinophagaceae bacterium]
MIRAIIIDDQIHWIEELKFQLKEYCPDIIVLEQCRSSKEGLEAIKKLKPDLVFLDIEMPGMNGFELLEQFTEISFAVIFTTCYDKYAIKAIHLSALDYLLKPVDPKELVCAVKKIEEKQHFPIAGQFEILLNEIRHKDHDFNKLAVPTLEGFELIPTDQLMRCNANDNYTCFYMKDKNKIIACRTLKQIEEQLRDFKFFIRVHHSHIVNLNEVIKYIRGEGGYLVLSDGTSINVSKSRKDNLLNTLYPNRY